MNGENELPEGWDVVKLPDIVQIIMGQSPPGSTYNQRGEGLPFFQGKIDFTDRHPKIRVFCTEPRKIANRGDILLSVRAPVGPTNIANCTCVIGRGLAALSPLGGMPTEFILNYLRLKESELNASGTGSTFTAISKTVLEEFEIPLPPLAEQRRIVAAVDLLLARVNASRERLDRVPGFLKAFRQAVLAAACSGRLTEGWREEHPDVEPASSILEDNKNQKKIEKIGKKRILRESDNSTLIELPEKWLWVKWGLIGVSQNGRLFPSKEYQSDGVRLLRPGNLDANGKIIWTENNTRFLPLDYEKNFPEFVLKPNEIVMNLTAQSLKEEFLGRVCITGNSDHCLLNQRLARLIPINFSSRYAFWVFKSPHFRKFVDKLNTGSMIQHMFTSQLVEYDFPLPPLSEQHEIVHRVESLFALADHIEQRVAIGKERADRLTQAILAKAFRGELVPTEAELARIEGREYESASVLLERIGKEKNQKNMGKKHVKRTSSDE